jgi:hypothetical protein
MTLGMQGSWTVSVKSKSAAWAQRFRIQGSTNGVDGVYTGAASTPAVFVTGSQWGITIEHNPTGPVSWIPSRMRFTNPSVSAGQFHVDIESDDGGGVDEDFNDLILTASMPLSSSEYIVYGNVKTYKGVCLFNPCYPFWYYVIDTPLQLKRLLEYEPARRVIEKLYPERVKPVLRRPFPEPDPAPFRPMMIPTGLSDDAGIVVTGGETPAPPPPKPTRRSAKAALETAAAAASTASLSLEASMALQSSLVNKDDLLAIARLKYRVPLFCETKPASETLLRFIEYDRTDAEKLGDPYTGEGVRQVLGLTATDEFGNYIFHFSQSLSDIVAETSDVGLGESLSTQIRPDVIVQIMHSLPEDISYETAPYYNIPNIRRIDLCIPEDKLGHRPTCQGGRAIQEIGDIFVIPNPDSTLHADGTISNTGTSGPTVNHAAWTGVLDIHACFLDTEPKVKYYVMRYRREGESDFSFINEAYFHLKQQPDATWLNTKVGPDPRSLRVNGPSLPMQVVDSYLNIEEDSEWALADRDIKLALHTSIYQPVAGKVDIRIEGYDASGEFVPGAIDTITLMIDNHLAQGDIDSIKLGSLDPGECALFDLSSPNQALTVRYRVTDAEGFMSSYEIDVYRGSNTFVPTLDNATSAPVSYAFPATHSVADVNRFRGTLDQTLDPTGYLDVDLIPSGGANWLPSDKNFCAFSFELWTVDRLTNGKGTIGSRLLWRELIGISYNAP